MNLIHMSKSNFKFIFWMLLIGIFGCKKADKIRIDTNNLLPGPQQVTLKEGSSINPKKFKTIYLYSKAGDETRFAANLLKDEIKELFDYGVSIEVIQSYDAISFPAIVLGIPSVDKSFLEFTSALPPPHKENAESYVLEVKDRQITISGGSEQGLFYGVQTLIQLLEEASWENESIPGMVMEDWPDMKLRWVHYNYFYHLDRFDYIKETIKKLAKYKINGVVAEFEDKFQYQSHPFIAAPNFLTPAQVKELTQFAHQYYVDIVPLVQGFGHAGYLLKHEEVKHLRENPEIYQSFCPLKEETYEFIFDLFGETIEATPGVKYFHVGADEVNYMGKCPLCKKKVEEIGELGLYLIWLDKVREFMDKHERTLVFWDDMPLKQADLYKVIRHEADSTFESVWNDGISKLDNIIDKFPENGIFMRWNYESGRERGNIQILDWYRENNFNAMIATAVIGDWPLIPKYEVMPSYIKSFVTLGAETGALGELCTAWGDDSGNHFEVFWFGFLESSEYAWSSKTPNSVEEYWQKYIRSFFGPNTEGLIPTFKNLAERVHFWDKALMKKGNKRRKGYQFITLPNLESTPPEGSWAKHFQPLMDTARSEKLKCAEANEILERNIGKATSNTYNLEVFASMGKFMEAYCDFVLSIGKIASYCDQVKAAQGESRNVDEQLNNMIAVADSAWNGYKESYEDLKDIWEVSRHPKGGEGYMMDTQTIYMAGRTADLSYLILAEEELDLPGYVRMLKGRVKGN